MLESNGKKPSSPQEYSDLLLYWVQERYRIYLQKEAAFPKPWSNDSVFQNTYFCNVHRENDRVTKWNRGFYSIHVEDSPWFEYNIVLSRFLNWPSTLEDIGYMPRHDPSFVLGVLERREELAQKVWGGAYLITTHGIPMRKAVYLCKNVLGSFMEHADQVLATTRASMPAGCAAAYKALQSIEGIGSFLAAQVVADLKNTPGHPLFTAEDRKTFVAPGPGSLRGLAWLVYGSEKGMTTSNFLHYFRRVEQYIQERLAEFPEEKIPFIDSQDLQNCLCEFDKYCRVLNGTGKSKRNYNGF